MGRKYSLPTHDAMVDNILATWHEATDNEKTDGRTWYVRAHSIARNIADETGETVRLTAGIMARLSPANSWERNIADTRNLLQMGEDATVATYNQNRDAALKMRETGNVTKYIGNGLKTQNFWKCIEDPTRNDTVTVDRHAIKVATGGKDIRLTPRRYERVATAFRDASTILGERPMDVQAVTWLVWRHNYAGRYGNGFRRAVAS